MTARQRFRARSLAVAARAALRSWGGRHGPALPAIRTRGQSLVEFALILPALLLLTMVALDFGRMYLGYINLQNLTRVAGNFAANNPNAWLKNQTGTITKYRNQVLADAANTNCSLSPATPANPVFTDADNDGIATGVGDSATVTFTCNFKVITPIISSIIGANFPVTAKAVFPVKSALSATSSGGGGGCQLPAAAINANPQSGTVPLSVTFMDASGGGAGVTWAWTFGDGATSSLRDPGTHVYTTANTYVVTLSVTNVCGTSTTNPGTTITVTAASPPLCTVPNFNGVHINSAQGVWTTATFTTTVQQAVGHPNGNYSITSQSIVAGSRVGCGSTITVNG
jgi:PKD repeat protein